MNTTLRTHLGAGRLILGAACAILLWLPLLSGCGGKDDGVSPGPSGIITVEVPNGGEIYVEGDTLTIEWSSDEDACGATVKIELIRNGQVCLEIAASTANDGVYDWAIAQCSDESSGYKIRVTDIQTQAADESNGTFTINVYAGVFYVATDGDDANPGTKAEPWKTIGKAAEALTAGQIVYIRAGTYAERVIPANSGTLGSYITYSAYPGEAATIDGSSITLEDETGLFEIADRSYVVVTGLRVMNVGPGNNNVGILVHNSSYITIRNCYTYNTTSSGIAAWNCTDITIDGNEVELACNGGEHECLTVAGTTNFTISYNHVHDSGIMVMGGEGIDAKDGSANGSIYRNHVHDIKRLGIYVDAWDKHTHGINVYQNVVHDCDADGITVASEAGGLLENIQIYNNICYSNKYNGIGVSSQGEGHPTHPLRNITIINNTLYGNGSADWGGGILIDNSEAENVIFRNNLCSENVAYQIADEVSSSTLTVDHNLIYSFRGYEGELRGTNYIEADPRLSDPSAGDFRLFSNSPARDTGSPNGAPSTDYDGISRPQGATWDIGAHEYRT